MGAVDAGALEPLFLLCLFFFFSLDSCLVLFFLIPEWPFVNYECVGLVVLVLPLCFSLFHSVLLLNCSPPPRYCVLRFVFVGEL